MPTHALNAMALDWTGWHVLSVDETLTRVLVMPERQQAVKAAWRWPFFSPSPRDVDRESLVEWARALGIGGDPYSGHPTDRLFPAVIAAIEDRELLYHVPAQEWPAVADALHASFSDYCSPVPASRPSAPEPILAATAEREPEVEPEERCDYCGKRKHQRSGRGNHIGSSETLNANIFKGTAGKKAHRWYTSGASIAAHHLICAEAMKSELWARYCADFSYDINRKQNGVMLPMKPDLACQLHVALHIGNHDAGSGSSSLAYPAAVIAKLDNIAIQIEDGGLCAGNALSERLDQLSAEILGYISAFTWTITSDGHDYKPGGNGCAGVQSIQGKPARCCPANREHGLARASTGVEIEPNRTPLQVGT